MVKPDSAEALTALSWPPLSAATCVGAELGNAGGVQNLRVRWN